PDSAQVRHMIHKVSQTPFFFALSLRDALPIWPVYRDIVVSSDPTLLGRPASVMRQRRYVLNRLDEEPRRSERLDGGLTARPRSRSEEHTSELQSREKLVCRLLIEKNKPEQI